MRSRCRPRSSSPSLLCRGRASWRRWARSAGRSGAASPRPRPRGLRRGCWCRASCPPRRRQCSSRSLTLVHSGTTSCPVAAAAASTQASRSFGRSAVPWQARRANQISGSPARRDSARNAASCPRAARSPAERTSAGSAQMMQTTRRRGPPLRGRGRSSSEGGGRRSTSSSGVAAGQGRARGGEGVDDSVGRGVLGGMRASLAKARRAYSVSRVTLG
mmetsp:Transcript_50797/g.162563  ORF Transcript_50797/g.162563 Transcript_50797/m.162563 type:complete len:217 (-) Transcript_50797:422-1072(-)